MVDKIDLRITVQETVWMKLLELLPIRVIWKYFPNVTMANFFCKKIKVGDLKLRQMVLGAR